MFTILVEIAMELGLHNLEIEKFRQKHESTRGIRVHSQDASGLAHPGGIGETSESPEWTDSAGTRVTCQVTRERVASLNTEDRKKEEISILNKTKKRFRRKKEYRKIE